ncbi:VanW family protein [Sutcliffiella halmapala]|uniref:VanW family protein n=1 Tax=Sutcliffiella halmapala TaxID=79882 RepID=UPI0009959C22|nr:VanW family protein [Sutcliffiella halmapala]
MIKILLASLLLLAPQSVESPDNYLTITQHGQKIITMNREDFMMPLPGTPLINEEKYEQFIETIDTKVYQEPQNAMINDLGGIAKEQVGYRLDRQLFREYFYKYFFSNGPSEVEAPLMEIYPKVDSELLSQIRVQQIGQYATYFNSYNKSRSHNIFLAAQAVDNHVVFPNETFSFNKVVGKRTTERGYLRAPIIVSGELAEGVGGGICQVSSTLFNAVDRAGLKIVERYSHSRKVPYVPPRRDATVSWYGPDFRFQNQYNQPILIRAKRYGGMMVVKLYSSDVINYEPKVVPNAPSELPKEIHIEHEIHRSLRIEPSFLK